MNLTGRPIYQKGQTAPKKARKLANKAKKPRQGDDPAHLSFVRSLPCCICWEWGMQQNSPTEAHHCQSPAHEDDDMKPEGYEAPGLAEKSPDSMAIPLCHSHHNKLMRVQGDEDKIGYHNGKREWERRYGPDHHWINWVEARKEAHDASFI